MTRVQAMIKGGGGRDLARMAAKTPKSFDANFFHIWHKCQMEHYYQVMTFSIKGKVKVQLEQHNDVLC